MTEHTSSTPSELVFEAARTIAKDLKEGVEASTEDIADYVFMLDNMISALKDVKRNLEKHAIPLLAKRSKTKRDIRRKVAAIIVAIQAAERIRESLVRALEDIADVMKPFSASRDTERFFDRLIDATDKELRGIEDEGEEEDSI